MSQRILEPAGEYESLEDAKQYNDIVQKYKRFVHDRFLQAVIKHAPHIRTARVLDLGAGSGQIAIDLVKKEGCEEVVAFDVSSHMIDIAKQNATAAAVEPHITFVQGDASEALPFVNASFDVVVCHNTLHHFVDPAHVIAEMCRVTAPRGHIFIQDFVRPPSVILAVLKTIPLSFNPSISRQSKDSLQAALSWTELQRLKQSSTGRQWSLRRVSPLHARIVIQN